MSASLRHVLLHWADERLHDMLSAPRMWGSLEAVELQVLLLIELKTFVRHPSFTTEAPRHVIDEYLNYLTQRHPKAPGSPLHALYKDEGEFVSQLRDVQTQLEARILDENPFEHSELAISLEFSEGRAPSATAFTTYYEEFRRATRAMIGSREHGGRPTKAVEQATDFSIEDVRITPQNGAPAKAVLLLGTPHGQQDFEARERVRDSLVGFATMAEWAASNASLADLAVDNAEARTRVAVQALRVVPRRGIQTVSIGGKLMGRTKPIQLLAEQERRFVEVISAGSVPEDFEQEDEVRAIDLDRGTIRLGKKPGTTCYVRPEQLAYLTEVGVRAKVVGKRYRLASGRPLVLASSVEPQDSGEE